ncbi:F-box domain-containing protein [Mycena chlorophos]|uniref:F-box domain-containing protein n=1 Tax=Mycena chlorophos TaxID=658473 RepID=A0A8H6WJ23_MYCCL|nr:F-box domain-containing protein [Mycena chlorophos]
MDADFATNARKIKTEMSALGERGEYVLFDNQRALECWSVRDGRLMWSHREDNWSVGGFAFDMLPGGRQVHIMVCIYQQDHGWTSSRLDILELDLVQESSEMRYTSHYSAADDDVHWTHLGINGSFALCSLYSTIPGPTELHALHDWKTAPGKCLSVASPEGSQLALTTAYLIIATFDPSIRETQIRIVSLADLQSVGPWYGFFNDAGSVNVAELPTLSNFVFPMSVATMSISDVPSMRHLSVHRSPLDENVYRIWLRWAGFRRLEVVQGHNRVTFGDALYGYHLLANPDNARDVSLYKRMDYRTGSKGDTTYSGHGIRRQRLRDPLESDSYVLYAPGEPDPVASLRATGAALFPSLSVYSSAVTYAERVVRVAYFD